MRTETFFEKVGHKYGTALQLGEIIPGSETSLKSKLLSAIRKSGDLSPYHFDFRVGGLTMDAIQKVIEAVRKAENYSQRP